MSEGKPSGRDRIKRTRKDMLAALARHVRLLESYTELAKSNPDYLGEVAGKLRLLVVETKQNRPLLLTLADPEGPAITWPAFLDSTAGAYNLGSPEFVTVSYKDLIRAWAEQMGAPHEDWAIDEKLSVMLTASGRVGDLQISANNLLAVAQNVIRTAKTLMEHVPSLNEEKGKAIKKGGA